MRGLGILAVEKGGRLDLGGRGGGAAAMVVLAAFMLFCSSTIFCVMCPETIEKS